MELEVEVHRYQNRARGVCDGPFQGNWIEVSLYYCRRDPLCAE